MKTFTLVIITTMVLFGCALPVDDGVTLGFQSSPDGSSSRSLGRAAGGGPVTVAPGIIFDSFKLSIREVEFKHDESDPSSPDDVYFTGPFELGLLSPVGALYQTIGTTVVTPGTYQELRFKLHKTLLVDPADDLYDRSIFVSGTINGTPFEMWHDTNENLDVGKATGIVVTDQPLDIIVDFNLADFLDQAAGGGHDIDLSTAVDGDLDGIIEISPSSGDGTVNQSLSEELKDNIKLVADFL